MLKFTAAQFADSTRRYFYARVETFIRERTHREDFRAWAADSTALQRLWDGLWPAHARHSEHDVAVAMVLLAACRHAGVDLAGEPLEVLESTSAGEVRIKQWLADQGYFDFTAFDMPADPTQGAAR